MGDDPALQPLPRMRRRYTFMLLVGMFVVALPVLFLYATGYRFELGKEMPFVSTGGIYVAADRIGAEIYIDDQLVRETRTFRKAFYAQGLEPGVHKVHVQKPGHHTWVKELPVYPYIVTEAIAFNIPEVPNIRVISPWRTSDGLTVVSTTSTLSASTTNEEVVSAKVLSSFVPDTEYATLLRLFATSTEATSTRSSAVSRVADEVVSFLGSSATTTATTTKTTGGVELYEADGSVYARWVGLRDQMPYYYCAKDFETTTTQIKGTQTTAQYQEGFIGPVQHVPDDAVCDPVIKLDNGGEKIHAFDFYPGSTDLVLLARDTGIYVIEIDNRAWQNVQPLLLGRGLDMRVENSSIYVYDGELIYQVLTED